MRFGERPILETIVIAMMREPSFNVLRVRARKTYEPGGGNSILMAVVIA